MLNLKMSRRSDASAIPAHVTVLSVSWLNNAFKAVAVNRGIIEAAWECPSELNGGSQFEELLREAVKHTGYRGQNVILVLAHPRLAQQMFDAPPVNGSTLLKVVERQAQRQKLFAGEAAWTYQMAYCGKGPQRVVLHLLPRSLRSQLIQGARRNNLHLLSIVPPSAVLQQQLVQLPFQQGDCALVAAETAGSTTVVVGRKDGQVVLVRTLPGTWNDSPERLGLDLNRTVLFVSQQYGISINSGAWLFGPGAGEHLKEVQTHVQIPVALSPAEEGLFYWAAEIVKLRSSAQVNFITPMLQKAPQRRIFAKVVAAAACAVFLGCTAASGLLWRQARQEQATVKTLSAQWQHLQGRHQDLQRQDAQLSGKAEVVQLVMKDRPPPVALWLLAYLGEAVPPELVVTNLSVLEETNRWRVRLEGTAQKREETETAPDPSAAFVILKDRLANGPFHVHVAGEEEISPNAGSPTPRAGDPFQWVKSFSSTLPVNRKAAAVRDHFAIEGVIQ